MPDSWNPCRAHAGPCTAGWRLDVDQNFRAPNTVNGSQYLFRIVFNRRWNIRIVRRQGELHFDFAIVDIDRLDQAKRNDVTTEAGVFHRLQRVHRLFL